MSQCRCLLMVIRGGKERSRGHLIVTEEAGEGNMGTGETAGTAREPGEPPPLNTERVGCSVHQLCLRNSLRSGSSSKTQ